MGILDRELRSEKNEDLFYDVEMKLVPVLMGMEMTGVKLDTSFLKAMSADFSEQMMAMEQEIYVEAGMEFNINSPQQLGYILFEKLQLPGQKKTAKSKKYSTDVKVLEKLSAFPHRLPRLILRYRTLSKLKSTYLDALVQMVNPATGRLHTSYNQTVTATGRLSSSNPNLQNIPIRSEEGRAIRRAFVAEKGHVLVSADYSQIELRVFAHYSKDPAFLEAFHQEEDIHARTASEIRNIPLEEVTPDMRRIAKAINFGIIYGMGPRRLSEEQGIDLKTAKDYIAQYMERYQGAARFREEMVETASKDGFVSTLFGRRRYLPNISHSDHRLRAEAERMAVNTPIQGTAADLIKKAMIVIDDELRKERRRARMLLQVHDELVFEVPLDELEAVVPMIQKEMEEVYPLRAPLRVEIHSGGNWDEAH
jgi:DNA polymerase-1